MPDEPVIAATEGASDPAPVETAPVTTETQPVEAAPVEATPADPNNPFAALEAAMNAQLGEDAPASPGEAPAIPAEFQNVLQLSEYVKSPEHVEQAVRAADEVWKVANGQVPASSLLEGMRSANPQGFEAVIQNLVPYIEQITGKKFGGEAEAAPDPRDQRLSAIEQRFQQEEQQRQQVAYQQQSQAAGKVAREYLTTALKGTFAEGQEAFILAQCASKVGIPEPQMVQQLLTGNTKTLETAMRAVQKEETARLKAYNANLVKQYHASKNSVPATKGNVAATKTKSSEDYLPGETAVQYATRRFNESA